MINNASKINNVILILFLLIFGILLFGCTNLPKSENLDSDTSKDIQLKSPSEVLGFGKYIKNPYNVAPDFIDARILTPPGDTQTQYYELCGSDQNSANLILTKYLAYENHDFILDNPQATLEQKKQRMAEGYGTWHLVDSWKVDTHYHFVIATAGESFWKHVILEDCNYFTPTTEKQEAITLSEDYQMPIGTFKYTPKTSESFLNFLKYYYGKSYWTYIAGNKLYNLSVSETSNSITILFNVAITHSGDWGLPTEYTYHKVTHTLDKETGNMYVIWKKTGARTSGRVDETLLK